MNALKKHCFLLLIAICSFSWANENYISPKPNWVKTISTDYQGNSEIEGETKYNVYHLVSNIENETEYIRKAFQLLSIEAVSSYSTITLNYDPSYQKLQLHSLNVIRDGKVIDRLGSTEIETLKREENLENNLYDGSLTATLKLENIKVNDIIDYSYSIIGFNPIFKGNYSRTYDLELSYHADIMRVEVFQPKSKDLNIYPFNGAMEPEIESFQDFAILRWEGENIPPRDYEVNTPRDYFNHPYVRLTSFNSWEEYIDWAKELYVLKDQSIKNIANKISRSSSKSDKIVDYIKFVQDEVRYLGSEQGIGAYKPNKPSKVYRQLYGDCKDKSLLLVSLLQNEYVEAYPILVNSYYKKVIDPIAPQTQSFNHCIVGFEYEGENYIVDPTITYQGGDLGHFHQPSYVNGLALSDQHSNLIDMSGQNDGRLSIVEYLTLDSIGGDAKLVVNSTYTGKEADRIRDYVSNQLKEEIDEVYLNYYSSIYPNIELLSSVDYVDNYEENSFEVNEKYFIPDVWEYSEEDAFYYVVSYPLVLEEYLKFPKSAKREMPYSLGSGVQYDQRTIVNLPEEWEIAEEGNVIEDSAFRYEYRVEKLSNRRVAIVHNYDLYKSKLSADDFPKFQNTINDIKNNLSFYFTHTGDYSATDTASLSPSIFILCVILVFVFFLRKLHFKYDPPSRAEGRFSYDNVGGWMILPLIGLIISPFRLTYDLFQLGFLNSATWNFVYTDGGSIGFLIFFTLECIANVGLLVFAIFLIIQFFKRRTSLPNLISIYFLLNILSVVLDTWIADAAFDLSMEDEDVSSIVRLLVASCIWIPYFQISTRVKDTFVVRLRPEEIEEEGAKESTAKAELIESEETKDIN